MTVRVRRDAGQILFTSDPPPTRPRHSNNIPQWHYDMLNDAGRNDAYEAAIVAAVNGVRRAAVKSTRSTPGAVPVYSR